MNDNALWHEFLDGNHLTTSEARSYLSRVRSTLNFLHLFEHYFPSHFAEMMGQVGEGQLALFSSADVAYTQIEVRFLELVDEHLFPLPIEFLVDDTSAENRCDTIPIEPFGLHPFDGMEMDLGWQLIYYLLEDIQPGSFSGATDEELVEMFALCVEPGKRDGQALRAACASRKEPLAFLSQVVAMYDQDTDTTWLDATYEMSFSDAFWTIEVMDALKEQFLVATDIRDKADQFISWLEEDVVPHFTEVVRIWNACVSKEPMQVSA